MKIPLIVVVGTSGSDEDVVISMEVAYECDVDDNDEYSLETKVFSIVADLFVVLILEIPGVVVEINCVVDSSDCIDETRSF
jgi:hypothetical protein